MSDINTIIKVNQIKLNPNHTDGDLYNAVCKILGAVRNKPKDSLKLEYKIARKSIDSRYKPDIMYIYSVEISSVKCDGMPLDFDKFAKKLKSSRAKQAKDIVITTKTNYQFPYSADKSQERDRPVVIGFGPAGMFAALKLAETGFCPVVYERGESVDERIQSVNHFWETGELNTESNVQFGEGGAGTFSDGKLNTMIKDASGRIRNTLETFVRFGADSSILYVNKPHIGTDVLAEVVKNIREHIIKCGGEVNFNTKLENIIFDNGQVSGIVLRNVKTGETINKVCKNVCLAIGHSARDTFEMLNKTNLLMEPKSFAVGLRVEHPQSFIDDYSYGDTPYRDLTSKYRLPAADYKVTWKTSKDRGVYSFCMCPGGYVVNASSENGMLAVNGMSYSKRDSANANSAIIVTVTPQDFGGNVLDGMNFQRKLEKLAFEKGNGNIPVQLLGDFKNKRVSTGFGKVVPCVKGKTAFADLNEIMPHYISEAISEGVDGFANSIKGFNMEEAVFLGIESRTSSPLRILRNDELQASYAGLFPCGEGAGYAGGITSAAVDGIKVAEKMAEKIVKN